MLILGILVITISLSELDSRMAKPGEEDTERERIITVDNEEIAELKRRREELTEQIAETNRQILKLRARRILREEEIRKQRRRDYWTDGLAVLFWILVVWYIIDEANARRKEREFYNEWRRQASVKQV